MPHTALVVFGMIGAVRGAAGVSWASGVTIGGIRPDGSAEQIRFRPTLRTRLLPLLAIPLGVLLGTLMALLTSHGDASAVLPLRNLLQPVLAGLGTTGLLSLLDNRGVTLRPDALVVHRFGRFRLTVPWTAIEGFTIRDVLSTQQIVVHRADGRRIRLRGPIGGFLGDPEFQAKYHTIGTWWLAGTGRATFSGPVEL
jgi:hypothetical protein